MSKGVLPLKVTKKNGSRCDHDYNEDISASFRDFCGEQFQAIRKRVPTWMCGKVVYKFFNRGNRGKSLVAMTNCRFLDKSFTLFFSVNSVSLW